MPGHGNDELAKRILEVYAAHGYVKTDKRTGDEVKDDSAVKARVFELFRDHYVVNSEADIIDGAASQQDSYAKVFPDGPGADGVAPTDDLDHDAWQSIRRKLWAFASPEMGGHCQVAAEMAGLNYVMVQKKVYRPTRDLATGTVEPKPVEVRFFTSNPEMVFEYSSLPAMAKMVRIAEGTAKHLEMNRKRHPELGARLAKEAKAALSRSASELTAITSGSSAARGTGAGVNGNES
jgi:hypothetical protein